MFYIDPLFMMELSNPKGSKDIYLKCASTFSVENIYTFEDALRNDENQGFHGRGNQGWTIFCRRPLIVTEGNLLATNFLLELSIPVARVLFWVTVCHVQVITERAAGLPLEDHLFPALSLLGQCSRKI